MYQMTAGKYMQSEAGLFAKDADSWLDDKIKAYIKYKVLVY